MTTPRPKDALTTLDPATRARLDGLTAAVTRSPCGVVALLSGTSGTGKTLAATYLAEQLGRTLLTVDLSRVVSKYIGETEKNLKSLFAGAERSGAILFFDEADALFGRRAVLRPRRSRDANLDVSRLRRLLEGFDGVAILAADSKIDGVPAEVVEIRTTS